MLCDNCGKREANVKYSESINGMKKEMNLCEECAKKLGITNQFNFNMPLDFPNFFGSFLEDFSEKEFMPLFEETKSVRCDNCGTTFEDIVNNGRLGCANCYNVFGDKLDSILKRLQGSSRHVGRLEEIPNTADGDNKIKESENEKEIKTKKKDNKLEELQEDLKAAIKDERYEDAAKIRDEIKQEEKNNKKDDKK